MSRSDQFIGLTKEGQSFLNDLEKDYPIKYVTIGDWAFNPGKIQGAEVTTKDFIYREEIQLAPWSSGPMYLTCINIYDKQSGKCIGSIYPWVEDKKVKGEIDYDHGKYWI